MWHELLVPVTGALHSKRIGKETDPVRRKVARYKDNCDYFLLLSELPLILLPFLWLLCGVPWLRSSMHNAALPHGTSLGDYLYASVYLSRIHPSLDFHFPAKKRRRSRTTIPILLLFIVCPAINWKFLSSFLRYQSLLHLLYSYNTTTATMLLLLLLWILFCS